MIYELMHCDIVVAEVEINESGQLKKLLSIINADHFPYGTLPRNKTKDPSGLIRWWDNRRIPISRDDLENIRGIKLLNEATPGMVLLACQGLSLSDCYWIREKGKDECFADLNFFNNAFSFDFGDVLVGKKGASEHLVASPDGTSEGNLKKRWKIIDGKRVLLKSGTPPYRYEVYNEVIASIAMKHLNIPHVDYFFVEDGNELYCGCEDFISYSQDFVTAYMIHEGNKKSNSESEYEFMIRCYESLGIENAKESINKLLLVDYLLGNEDRHLNNFGLIRDAKTMAFLGPAPIFDTGSCLGYESTDEQLSVARYVKWKPFQSHGKPSQLDYIDILPSSITADALLSLPQIIAAACLSFPESFSKKRGKAIVRFIGNRVAEICSKYGLKPKETRIALSKTQAAILHYIHSIGGILYNAQDVCNALGIAKITAIRNLDILAKRGLIIRVGARKTGYWEIIDGESAIMETFFL